MTPVTDWLFQPLVIVCGAFARPQTAKSHILGPGFFGKPTPGKNYSAFIGRPPGNRIQSALGRSLSAAVLPADNGRWHGYSGWQTGKPAWG